jgi:hypothetical protein
MAGDAFDRFKPPERGRFGDNERAPDERASGQRVTGASDLVDLKLIFRHDKGRAFAFVHPRRDGEWVWLAKSLIECDPEPLGVNQQITVAMPRWLAKEKGLI